MGTVEKARVTDFRARLTARRDELYAEINGKLAESQEHSTNATIEQRLEGGDQALAALIADTDMTIARREIEELRDTDAALARIDAGAYGVCIDCGDAIAPERLNAYPTAKRCAHCQERHERLRGSGAGRSL